MKATIKNKIEELLSKEFYCTPKQLNKSSIIYSVNPNTEQPYIKIMTYRNCIVVCTSENLQPKVQELLQNKNKDEIFELPLVYGQTIHYVPNDDCREDNLASPDFRYEYRSGSDILTLAGLTGFENSLEFDENGLTPTQAVQTAKHRGQIIGVAGAAKSSVDGVWEIGVDVLEEYRNAGLGTYLVKKLTRELLAQNIVPFYSASITNIGSQMVAGRCGYIPFWVDTYGTLLDGSSAYDSLVQCICSTFSV